MATMWLRNSKKGQIYYVSFYYRGKRFKISTGTSDHKLAKTVLDSINKKIILDQFDINDYKQKDMTLSEYGVIFFQNVIGTKKESTIIGQKIYFTTFIKIVGDVRLTSIDLVVLERWRSIRLSQVTPTTYNIERAALSAIFTKAVEYQYLKDNPFKKLKEMKVPERRLYLTMEEEERFFKTLSGFIGEATNRKYKETYRLFKMFVEFQLDTGMRRDETLTLQLDQIDFQRGVIMVEKSKGKTIREIPMTLRGREIIRLLGDNLFHSLSSDQVSRKFSLVAEKAKLSGFKQHSLRHTFATRLLALGVDISIVSKLLGHSSIDTTMIYAKATLETLMGAIRTLDTYRNGNISPSSPFLGNGCIPEVKLLKN